MTALFVLLRKVLAVVGKDVAAELRTREMFGYMFVFAVLVIFVFNFAFELRTGEAEALAPGVLWVAISFSGMLGLSRSFILERDTGALDGLLLAPVDRSAIYLGKAAGNAIFMMAVEIIVLPLFIALFNLPIRVILPLGGVMLLGTIGLAGVGTLFSAMAVHTRAREVMLPVLFFPVVLPAILAAVRLSGGIIEARPFSEMQNWLGLLAAFDAVFLAVSYLVFDYVVEE